MSFREPFDEDLELSIFSTLVVFCFGSHGWLGVRLASAQRFASLALASYCQSHFRGEVLTRGPDPLSVSVV